MFTKKIALLMLATLSVFATEPNNKKSFWSNFVPRHGTTAKAPKLENKTNQPKEKPYKQVRPLHEQEIPASYCSNQTVVVLRHQNHRLKKQLDQNNFKAEQALNHAVNALDAAEKAQDKCNEVVHALKTVNVLTSHQLSQAQKNILVQEQTIQGYNTLLVAMAALSFGWITMKKMLNKKDRRPQTPYPGYPS